MRIVARILVVLVFIYLVLVLSVLALDVNWLDGTALADIRDTLQELIGG